jgi:hypothetical protein
MNWFWRLRHREQLDLQLEKELGFHIQQHTDDLIAQGYSPEEAHHHAMIAFGGAEQVKEGCREVRGTRWLEDLGKDLRYSVRVIVQAPSFAIIAVVTLALGIGANTAMFSVVNAVLLRPLPFPHPERLMSIVEFDSQRGAPRPDSFSYPDYFDVRSKNHSFEAMASYRGQNFSLSGDGEAIYLRGQIVGSDLFKVLGVQPALGRGFRADEDQAGHHVIVISNALWHTRFHGDRNVVGRNINLSGNPYTIVGVTPAGFQFPVQAEPTDIWVPISPEADPPEPVAAQRGAHMLGVIGLLRPGVIKEQAQADLCAGDGQSRKAWKRREIIGWWGTSVLRMCRGPRLPPISFRCRN